MHGNQGRSNISTSGLIVFSSGRDADRLVAGIPAAARVVREARLAGLAACQVSGGAGWQPNANTRAETARLGEAMPVSFTLTVPDPLARFAVIRGDALPPAGAIAAAVAGGNEAIDGIEIAIGSGLDDALARAVAGANGAAERLKAASRKILQSTAKPTDGIVSRHINRPISQAISAVALRVPGFRPIHATVGTALIAIAMFACLLFGGEIGLIAGALLFQAASVFDGVDGEVSRATWRTSPEGARMDSLIDAVTNLAFMLGVALNLQFQGRMGAAALGYIGLGLLAVGLFMIGRVAARSKAPFSFDLVKEHYRAKGATGGPAGMAGPMDKKPSQIMQWLTFMTSRDFFALVFALLIAVGLAAQVLALFAIAAAGWLVAVILALAPKQA
ncbi:CDP-L-myo-inositol myo-inositolphosphotransferase [Novosphingobium hassiacum]|uniref:CDP-L-myo-inositol myo-inositolphosphotransferase n=1 Tax=Novosphingobium hassiacum TaxID=173676 RepID=A0A7W5ZVI2_9SPHN|nr:CDP-alcohol phosphatidyltransferase family protein [Novosphingobium hassiacum]MBB3859843.1 CDP-L-myo-inositol myo-inositolphosphotransferase [Novosphingobium hassiacum]